MIQIETTHYKRITKAAARKRYEAGLEINLTPCKLNPESPWGLLYWPSNNERRFNCLIAEYTGYNCTPETGRYPAFYIRKEN